jgi:hypothetical protein
VAFDDQLVEVVDFGGLQAVHCEVVEITTDPTAWFSALEVGPP